MLRTVRDLALGLRPSMLDDLGLQPALEWHVRDFRRRYSMRVGLTVTGDLSDLPDTVRTCAYRIVQEALTNCARHAKAGNVNISVCLEAHQLEVSVVDDGVGFDTTVRPHGLGLLGIEERVRELRGVFTIQSAPAQGTRLMVTIPASEDSSEGHVARVAS
jgi:signal transduction histidine kinase